jgi:hypothetical protein
MFSDLAADVRGFIVAAFGRLSLRETHSTIFSFNEIVFSEKTTNKESSCRERTL